MSHKKYYIVRSKTKRPENPTRCWHNIELEKLERAAASNEGYCFQYTIDGKVYRYFYPARDLLDVFQQKNVRIMTESKWDFFGEYQTGRLFQNLRSSDTEVLVQLYSQD